MKLFYASANKYPSHKFANTAQIMATAREFKRQLGHNFYLGGKNFILDKKDGWQVINGQTPRGYFLAYKFLGFIRKHKIEAVYCREARLLFFLVLYNRLFFRRRLKFIYEVHALVARNLIDKLVERYLAARVDKFIFVTEQLQDVYVKKYHLDRNKALVAPDAVDLAIFALNVPRAQARQRLAETIPALARAGTKMTVLGYTGKFKTMGMDKGISDILRALSRLPDNVIFIAVGGSQADIDDYQKLARELKVENRVVFVGHISQPELALFQQACDILLMPFPLTEHYAYYMSPLKMFEYLAAGRPIIATDLPAVKEVLNNDNAILVKPDNPADLAAGISRLLSDPDLSEIISAQARRDARKYSWAKRVESILGFIGR